MMNSHDHDQTVRRYRGKRFYLRAKFISLTLLAGCSPSQSVDLRQATARDLQTVVAGHKGQEAVLLNFWSTGCGPCVVEFPMIVELGNLNREKGLAIYFVNVDWVKRSEIVRSFLDRQGVVGLSFIKNETDTPFINGISPEWSGALPFTITYGRKSGEPVDYWEDSASRERFETAIAMALAH